MSFCVLRWHERGAHKRGFAAILSSERRVYSAGDVTVDARRNATSVENVLRVNWFHQQSKKGPEEHHNSRQRAPIGRREEA